MSTIISVSISAEQAVFLKDSGLSASALLQNSINNALESQKVSSTFVKSLQSRINMLQETILKQGDFIESKGLMLDFIKKDVILEKI